MSVHFTILSRVSSLFRFRVALSLWPTLRKKQVDEGQAPPFDNKENSRGLKEHPPYPSPRKLEHLGIEIQDSHTPSYRTRKLVFAPACYATLAIHRKSSFPAEVALFRVRRFQERPERPAGYKASSPSLMGIEFDH
ncbi:hypothetical protein Salat_2963800 [Sesamum alatum]|uniref:Uncharacterized protein n=1 Tax=Sesamum alatum TaxID=300844 RepID=A0AAE1XI04_9LAMI|nr:hypothetical protein Salat_2968000 [Sesamum alatum]KAK4412225.1 hypothetical protein Salat_2963800 [Sesamum alatum]